MSATPVPLPTSPKKKTVGTKTTEAIIGTAATKLATAAKALQEANGIPAKLEEVLSDFTIKVADYETRIEALDIEFKQKKAEQAFQLQLDYKISQKEFADKYLQTAAMTAVPVEDYRKLQSELLNLRQEFDQKLQAEVGKAHGIQASKAASDAKLMTAEFTAKEAQNTAKISQLEAQLASANEQTKMWKESLDKEREAGIEKSKNSMVNQTITSGGK